MWYGGSEETKRIGATPKRRRGTTEKLMPTNSNMYIYIYTHAYMHIYTYIHISHIKYMFTLYVLFTVAKLKPYKIIAIKTISQSGSPQHEALH